MSRTLLIRAIAVLVVVASLAAIILHLRGEEKLQFPRASEEEMMQQAEHDGMRFLMHFDGGGWRGFPPAARVVWSTIRFEVQVTAFNGLGLASASGPMEPTADELVEAYRELGVPEAEPVLAEYGRLRSADSAAEEFSAWRPRFLTLTGRISDARKAYLTANVGDVMAAMSR